MNAFSSARIEHLARSLELSTSELLVVAMQLAAAEDLAKPSKRLHRTIAQVRAASRESEAAAMLLATPIACFAKDDVDRALAMLWSNSDPARD